MLKVMTRKKFLSYITHNGHSLEDSPPLDMESPNLQTVPSPETTSIENHHYMDIYQRDLDEFNYRTGKLDRLFYVHRMIEPDDEKLYPCIEERFDA